MILVTESLVELFDVLVCLVTVHGCIKLGVNDKDNASAQDVVVTQVLVDRIQLAPTLRQTRVTCRYSARLVVHVVVSTSVRLFIFQAFLHLFSLRTQDLARTCLILSFIPNYKLNRF